MSTQYTKLKIGEKTTSTRMVDGKEISVDAVHVEQVEPVKGILKLDRADEKTKSLILGMKGGVALLPCLEGATEQGNPWFSLREGEIIPLSNPNGK